jgi:hypothetical protein
MSEKEARERAGRLREATSAAGSARTPPIGAKASGTLRGILHVYRKAIPSALGEGKPDLKLPAKSFGETLTRVSGGRDGLATMGDLFVDLKLEGLDATQMDDLGGVTDEIMAAHMEIFAEMRSRTVEKKLWGTIRRMRSLFLVEGPITQQLQSSKLETELCILVRKEMK